MMNQRAVHGLLRFVQGEGPPGSGPPQALADFRGYLEEHRYSPVVIPSCVSASRQFLLYQKGRDVSVQEARSADVEDFLETKMERYKRRYRRSPRNLQQWRAGYTGPIHRLLRMIDPHWPPPEPPRDDQERFRCEILDGYGRWLVDIRGLSQSTLRKNGDAARMFLEWLGTYGPRAGEVAQLRLEDIDWRGERVRVRQSKTGAESHVPLVRPVGEALLKYIRKGRPATDAREVFMCSRAPYAPFRRGSSLYAVVTSRLKQAGIEVQGRHGSHAFRFARAGTLLGAEVPLKTIGDLLGHRSATSTEVYLRLATDDLRAISLDLPRKEDRCPRGRTKTKHS
jgi:integrase